MKIHITLIVFIIALGISSCKNKATSESEKEPLFLDSINQDDSENSRITQKTTYHIDFPSVVDQTREVFLSDLVKSNHYVPLDTTSKYMIGEETIKFRPCAEYIIIGEHGKPIGVFDLEGKFVSTIGVIGKGPGEYNFDYMFWPDGSTRRIYVANTHVKCISAYSFEGEHLGDIIPEELSMSFASLLTFASF